MLYDVGEVNLTTGSSMRSTGKFVEGMNFITSMKELYPNFENSSDSMLQYNAFIFYELNQKNSEATSRLKKLEELSYLGSRAKNFMEEANEQRFYTEIGNKNYDAAREHLKSARFNQEQYNKLISYLEQSHNYELKSSSGPSAAEAQKIDVDDNTVDAIMEVALCNNDAPDLTETEIAANSRTTSSTSSEAVKNIEDDSTQEVSNSSSAINFYNLDSKQIHAYFQRQKLLMAKKNLDNISQNDSYASWVAPDGAVFNSKQHSVLKVEGRDHYYICVKKGLALDQSFISALKKGVVSSSKGSVGLKFFKNQSSVEFVEIKTNGGHRAWAKTLYKNEKGEFLIVIDEYGNHAAAGKAAQKGMKVISVPSSQADNHLQTQLHESNVEHNYESLVDNLDGLKEEDSIDLLGSTAINDLSL